MHVKSHEDRQKKEEMQNHEKRLNVSVAKLSQGAKNTSMLTTTHKS